MTCAVPAARRVYIPAALRVYIRRVFHDMCHVCWRLYAALLLPRPTLPGGL